MVKYTAKGEHQIRRAQLLKGASIGMTIPKDYARVMYIKPKDFLKIKLIDGHLTVERMEG